LSAAKAVTIAVAMNAEEDADMLLPAELQRLKLTVSRCNVVSGNKLI
jgi:hypothetical protein